VEQNCQNLIKEIKDFIERVEQVTQHISEIRITLYSKGKITPTNALLLNRISFIFIGQRAAIELLVSWINRQNPAKLKV